MIAVFLSLIVVKQNCYAKTWALKKPERFSKLSREGHNLSS